MHPDIFEENCKFKIKKKKLILNVSTRYLVADDAN